MLVGYMRVSTDGDRQVLDLQRDALLAAGVDERHLFADHASGSRGDRAGLAKAGVHPAVRLPGIPSSRENPKICGIDDAEVVGDLIAVDMPVSCKRRGVTTAAAD